MYYKKLKTGETIIEFHNNWMGEETVIINGQIISKKSSVWGTNHPFTLIENGEKVNYILTTKVNAMMQVLLDLRKNGQIIHEDVVVSYSVMGQKPKNKSKISGIAKLKDYDLDAAIIDLKAGLDIDADDPEIYFYLACAYSIQENTIEAYENIRKSVQYNLQNTEMILNHDMLAYMRIQDGFEEFLDSNFSAYDIEKITQKNRR